MFSEGDRATSRGLPINGEPLGPRHRANVGATARARDLGLKGHSKGRKIAASNRRRERAAYQDQGRELARRGDLLHAAGCMLYWAEGSKARNQLQFCNSDPQLVRFFVQFLRQYFDLRDEDIRIACYLFADHIERQREIERFWLESLALPNSSLRRSIVNVYSRHSKKKRVNRLPYGTCRVVVSKTRVTQHIFGSIQEYGGFDRPEWLD